MDGGGQGGLAPRASRRPPTPTLLTLDSPHGGPRTIHPPAPPLGTQREAHRVSEAHPDPDRPGSPTTTTYSSDIWALAAISKDMDMT
eukprot:scaffold118511_cov28-Tisochrysis_lutea.AAC.1